MSDFRMVRGFEDLWRAPVRVSIKHPETGRVALGEAARRRLSRLAARTPEVMVKVTGRTRDPGHLAAHLTYITRNGQLPGEDRDGAEITGRREVLDLADDWAAIQLAGRRRRSNSPFSVGLILSMPAGTDPIALRDAGRGFARKAFAERFDYLLVLHTDTDHPHVHLTVRALGDDGTRLNPKKADLEAWRQLFAEALRDRGVAAEATPRRARGVVRKSQRAAVRRIADRAAHGGDPGRVRRGAYVDAAQSLTGAGGPTPWAPKIAARQQRTRAIYMAQSRILQASELEEDRDLGRAVEAFVRRMPAPETQREVLARELMEVSGRARSATKGRGEGGPERSH